MNMVFSVFILKNYQLFGKIYFGCLKNNKRQIVEVEVWRTEF